MCQRRSYDTLKINIGRSLITAFLSVGGLDYVVNESEKAEAADHLLIYIPRPLKELDQQLRSLTGGFIGSATWNKQGFGVISLNEREPNWEPKYQRSVIESYVIQITAALDWHIHEIFPNNIRSSLLQHFPEYAPNLLELRETRNCLLHSAGLIDNRYTNAKGIQPRSTLVGEMIPLDWNYAYERTINVLNFGEVSIEF